ncbi:MAG: glycerol kinase GlpK [Actinobacteria bacterium]|uniref:glycerol kinase n=1 Tax=freshwater metagenome TaxID=449393 RepID=A0A6J5Z8Y7_9ZZZZ|nr:glycerol kinase GlpK [Actinomycetota bacterium]MSX71965.1 glycerol kinase GlpK [Actinomycetota bacterium]MSY69394.1 glycerol kinase GlpK [Actinomycetota bacterium]MTA75956.1 glycerol kinase GlpK [Actinomycetota bacterium]
MRYVGSLDQGTSSTRFMIFDHAGKVVGQHQLEHRQILPKAGWVEHDANEIWQRVQEVITGALKQADILGSDLAAIGITNQRETTLIWDKKTGAPLANAIVWQDTRTTNFLETLSKSQKETIQFKTGLTIAPYFSASKMNWLLKNVASAKSQNAIMGTIDSWLLWNLSGGVQGGVHLTDVTNASRTLLMNLETLDWDEELLEIFGVSRTMLPTIKSSSETYALTNPHGPFGAAVPITGILGDQQAAMVGQVCFDRGESKTTYGTGNFALLNTGTEIVRSKNGLLTTVCFKFGDQPAKYALEGSVAVTGSAIQWLRDQLGIINNAAETENLASSVTDTAGVYFVPAFSGLFAPYWRSDARGAIVGLTRAATKAHLARAALEAICYQTRDVMDAMVADSGVPMIEMRVDGGITANSLCMQMQADIMGIDITRPLIGETTALGAAYAAGLAVGFWSSQDEVKKQWQQSRRWTPTSTHEVREAGYKQWKKAVERTLNWID